MSVFLKTTLLHKKAFGNNATDALYVSCYTHTTQIHTAAWNAVLPQDNIFLSLDYLQVVEKNMPDGLTPYYTIVYEKNKPIFIAYVQLYHINEAHINSAQNKEVKDSFWQQLKTCFTGGVISYLSCIDAKLLIVGNLLQTGSYGYASIGNAHPTHYIESIIKKIKETVPFDFLVIKDFLPITKADKIASSLKLQSFYTQPNMLLPIAAHWKTMSDYKADLLPKYRKRLVNTNNKSVAIRCEDLNPAAIQKLEKELYALYTDVYEKSTTKINKVPTAFFTAMKAALPNQFFIKGYFLEEQLVAFASYFINDTVLEANYVGFTYTLNKTHKLYQTILYDYLAMAIAHNCKVLNLGRTGLEIKSTIGAVPQILDCYLQLENKFFRPIVKPILKNIKQEKLEQRHPFQ
jgi:Peptidogalycan biosysnthesis/recognition